MECNIEISKKTAYNQTGGILLIHKNIPAISNRTSVTRDYCAKKNKPFPKSVISHIFP